MRLEKHTGGPDPNCACTPWAKFPTPFWGRFGAFGGVSIGGPSALLFTTKPRKPPHMTHDRGGAPPTGYGRGGEGHCTIPWAFRPLTQQFSHIEGSGQHFAKAPNQTLPFAEVNQTAAFGKPDFFWQSVLGTGQFFPKAFWTHHAGPSKPPRRGAASETPKARAASERPAAVEPRAPRSGPVRRLGAGAAPAEQPRPRRCPQPSWVGGMIPPSKCTRLPQR